MEQKTDRITAKRFFIWLLKFAAAGVCAFALLCAFCLGYYKLDPHIASKDGATDYVWPANSWSTRATEGISFVRVDENGYNNAWKGEGDPAAIVLGSSHTEAFNVAGDRNYVYKLNELLAKDGYSAYAYNLGISGHSFFSCAQNLSAAIEAYSPTDLVIIETPSIRFRIDRLNNAYNGRFEKKGSNTGGIITLLQKIPYTHLLAYQWSNIKQANVDVEDSGGFDYSAQDMNEYRVSLDALLGQMADTVNEHGLKLVILFQTNMSIDRDGNAYYAEGEIDENYYSILTELCEKYGITFVDVTDRFLAEYNESYVLPHGFINTAVEAGHLNADGHREIAEELAPVVEGLLAEGGNTAKGGDK